MAPGTTKQRNKAAKNGDDNCELRKSGVYMYFCDILMMATSHLGKKYTVEHRMKKMRRNMVKQVLRRHRMLVEVDVHGARINLTQKHKYGMRDNETNR